MRTDGWTPGGIVVLLSGGMDSATLLYLCKRTFDEVRTISFNYGQRHATELLSARAIADAAKVKGIVVDASHMAEFLRGSSQTDPTVDVPHGHYEDESMRATVVPNRNMILLSMASGAAISWGFPTVGYACHAGDHAIYPDCRPEFTKQMAAAMALCHYDGGIELYTPFETSGKHDVLRVGLDLGVPFELTWSCYEGGDIHCGRCGTCVERREAFELSGIDDPTMYKV